MCRERAAGSGALGARSDAVYWLGKYAWLCVCLLMRVSESEMGLVYSLTLEGVFALLWASR